uniref:Uncharacterized protein n=1 Tax=Cacopsylla melanoneura TaxID=428564 RepID=A0A8D9A3R7_9HEMI
MSLGRIIIIIIYYMNYRTPFIVVKFKIVYFWPTSMSYFYNRYLPIYLSIYLPTVTCHFKEQLRIHFRLKNIAKGWSNTTHLKSFRNGMGARGIPSALEKKKKMYQKKNNYNASIHKDILGSKIST